MTVHYDWLKALNLNIIYVAHTVVGRVMHVYSRSRNFFRGVIAHHDVLAAYDLGRDDLAAFFDDATRGLVIEFTCLAHLRHAAILKTCLALDELKVTQLATLKHLIVLSFHVVLGRDDARAFHNGSGSDVSPAGVLGSRLRECLSSGRNLTCQIQIVLLF